MVTIYLLGHRVGNIEEPVVYVNHKSYDYNGNVVTKGMPDPFVESLVHNSIIVQIPLLHGQINNHLEKVLSVFDQTKADVDNKHFLTLNGDTYTGDANMEYIVNRLSMAAADSEMRQNMNVEDEFYSAIEDRDTVIMNRDKKIKEQSKTISEQSNKISEQSSKISEQSNKISEQSSKISEQNSKISEQSAQIKSLASALKEKGLSEEQISRLLDINPMEAD